MDGRRRRGRSWQLRRCRRQSHCLRRKGRRTCHHSVTIYIAIYKRTGRRRRSGVTKVGPRIKFVYFTSYVRSMVFVLWSGTFRPRLASRGCRAAATVWPSAIARRSYWWFYRRRRVAIVERRDCTYIMSVRRWGQRFTTTRRRTAALNGRVPFKSLTLFSHAFTLG